MAFATRNQLSTQATREEADIYKAITHYSQQFRSRYNKISSRLLHDLAYAVVRTLLLNQVEARQLINFQYEHPGDFKTVLNSMLFAASAVSASFRRAWNAELGKKEPTAEDILVICSAGIETSAEEFAKKLCEGICRVSKHEILVITDASASATNTKNKNIIRIHHANEKDGGFVGEDGKIVGELGKKKESKQKYHRVIHITTEHQHFITEEQLRILLLPNTESKQAKQKGKIPWEPLYGSYIVTLLAAKPDRRMAQMETVEIGAHWAQNNFRINRDLSVLTADPDNPRRLPADPLYRQLNRWARNVTNLQVGFATSGGGASAYRTIAILKILERNQMWVDVFAGLSGGAVIGAFYAGDEDKGLEKAIEQGAKMGRASLPLMMMSTKSLESKIDKALGYQRINQTSMRLGMATTELPAGQGAPLSQLVCEGTIGQAARASGALPVMFAPTIINGQRFSDGMAAAIVPTEVAIEFGADVLLSCSCVPGPDRTNPFGDSYLGRIAYQTPLGRAIDSWTWINYMVQKASAAFRHGADVYYEFDPSPISSLEPMRWRDAAAICRAGWAEEDKIQEAVHDLKVAWDVKHKALTGEDYDWGNAAPVESA